MVLVVTENAVKVPGVVLEIVTVALLRVAAMPAAAPHELIAVRRLPASVVPFVPLLAKVPLKVGAGPEHEFAVPEPPGWMVSVFDPLVIESVCVLVVSAVRLKVLV